jgi:hypothetical protein
MNKSRLLIITILAMSSAMVVATPETEPLSATVPISLDHNRMTVEMVFQRADGTPRPAQAWVDSGGTGVILAETLARELGVDLNVMPAGGRSFVTATPVPALRLGGISLATDGMTFAVFPGSCARPGVQAECVLPARCFRKLHVIFDYPARQLTLARPGVLTPSGTAVACRVNPETGLLMVEATLGKEKAALGVDTGSAGTWISDTLAAALLASHPGWPRATGATGSTNFFGFPFETRGTLFSLAQMAVGPVPVEGEIAVLGLDQSMFDWYSQKSAAPVAGFLGADVLSRFRLEIDFPGQMTWWQASRARAGRDLDIVGLTLRAEADGSFTVAGVVARDGRPVVDGVLAGDQLLAVDGLDTAKALMGNVIGALRGRPGETRALRLRREGKEIVVKAKVERLP